MIHNQNRTQIESQFGPIQNIERLYGGDIADSYAITLNQEKYFLKIYSQNTEMAICEKQNLQEIDRLCSHFTPQIFFSNENLLLLEWIDSQAGNQNSFSLLGERLAWMHNQKAKYLGFYRDNFIGWNRQKNPKAVYQCNWPQWYWKNRICVQKDYLQEKGFWDREMNTLFNELSDQITDLLQEAEEPPALLHGDLWSGNYLFGNENKVYLIDPACYWGHPEADLAMTYMFGGFAPEFYTAYHSLRAFTNNANKRMAVYQLYHYMNHFSLFGESYRSSCISSFYRALY